MSGELQSFLDESEDILDNWVPGPDAASWSGDGSHEPSEIGGGYYLQDRARVVTHADGTRRPTHEELLLIGGPQHGQRARARRGTEVWQFREVERRSWGLDRPEDDLQLRTHLYVRRVFAFPPDHQMVVLALDGLPDATAQALLFEVLLEGQPGVRHRDR